MGVAASKRVRTTRKSSSSLNRRETYKFERFSTPSPLRVSSPLPPAPPPSPRLSPAAVGSLFFDKSLPVWTIIKEYLMTHDKDRAVFFFAEDAQTQYTESTIVSRAVLRWFDIQWKSIIGFCGDADIADNKARLRFRGDPYADIYRERNSDASSSAPRTSSSRFSDYVTYYRNIALCIRADGLIEGFMLITKGYRGDIELDVVCAGKRNRGIGKMMIQALKKYAISADIPTITLTAIPTSIGFYQKLGFRAMGPTGRGDLDMIWTAA
jgi:GNAT superfamily N-acetyltransferase